MKHSIAQEIARQTVEVDAPMLIRDAAAGGFLRTNCAFRALLGFSDPELGARPFVDFVHPADVPQLREILGVPPASCRVRHRTANGGFVPLEVRQAENDGAVVLWPDATVTDGDSMLQSLSVVVTIDADGRTELLVVQVAP